MSITQILAIIIGSVSIVSIRFTEPKQLKNSIVTDQAVTTDFISKSEDQSVLLFNGINLDGWHIISNEPSQGEASSIFEVVNKEIHVYGNQKNRSTQPFSGLFTNEVYSNYKLTLEYKWGNKKFRPRHDFVRDAGVIIHQHGPAVIWPNGIECQIQEGDTGDMWIIGSRATSKVNNVIRNYDPEGNEITYGDEEQKYHRFPRAYYWEQPGWNKLELIVKEDHATFWVNGHLVNEAIAMKYWDASTDTWKPLTEGRIMIQAEGAELFYRNIFLDKL